MDRRQIGQWGAHASRCGIRPPTTGLLLSSRPARSLEDRKVPTRRSGRCTTCASASTTTGSSIAKGTSATITTRPFCAQSTSRRSHRPLGRWSTSQCKYTSFCFLRSNRRELTISTDCTSSQTSGSAHASGQRSTYSSCRGLIVATNTPNTL